MQHTISFRLTKSALERLIACMTNRNSFNFIDVFSGAGGLSCGMELAGHRCILGIEQDKHAAETFALNHQHATTYCGDIRKLKDDKIIDIIDGKKIDAVIGGPPCQGFSTAGKGDPNDIRNQLFREFLRVVKITSPNYIVIENVTGILAEKNAKTLNSIFKEFKKLKFNLDVRVLEASQHGVPERRRRTIIIGSKINDEIIFPEPKKKIVTVSEALSDLKGRDGKIHNHDEDLANLKSKIDLERLKCIPEGKGIRYQKDEDAYLPPKLKLGINWNEIPEKRFRQTKLFRLDGSRPSPTIMTHRHSYYHPKLNRYLTQREAARLQSFPNDFIFTGPITSQWRQIGNAVPPLLGKEIGLALKKMKQLSSDTVVKKKSPIRVQSIRGKAFKY